MLLQLHYYNILQFIKGARVPLMNYMTRRAKSYIPHSELGLDFGPALKLRVADFKRDLD